MLLQMALFHSFLWLSNTPLYIYTSSSMVSLIVQLVKNLPAMQGMPVRFLGQEDLLEKGLATHSSILGLLS